MREIIRHLVFNEMNFRLFILWGFVTVMAIAVASATVALAVQVVIQSPDLVASLVK